MTAIKTQPYHFMGAHTPLEEAEWVIMGLPYDGTCSSRPGARFGPAAIRRASWDLETYSPILERDMEELSLGDAGDLELPFGGREEALRRIQHAAEEVISGSKHWVGLGGEHLVTLPVIEAHLKQWPDLVIVQIDAHTDLRDDYLGDKLSHAAVIRRISELIAPGRIAQIGIRSGTRDEFSWMKEHNTIIKSHEELQNRLNQWSARPIFLTIDLDVLDPSLFPGTGTPEPGGMTFPELEEWLINLKRANIIGLDVVELSPPYDPAGISAIVAAKVLREVLLIL